MTAQSNGKSFWVKIAIVCVVLAIVLNSLSFGLAFMFSAVVGGFVDIILFVVLDVFLAAILFAVDILLIVVDLVVTVIVGAVDIFVSVLLGALAIAGYAATLAVIIIPLALLYKYYQSQHKPSDAEYK